MSTDKLTQSARAVLDAWVEKHRIHFVSRSHGQCTTDTVSRDALMELAALAAVPVELHYRGVPQGWIDGALTSIEWAISSWRSDEARDAVRAYLGTALAHPAPQPQQAGGVQAVPEELRALFKDAMDWGRSYGQRLNLSSITINDVLDGYMEVAKKALAQPKTAPQQAQPAPDERALFEAAAVRFGWPATTPAAYWHSAENDYSSNMLSSGWAFWQAARAATPPQPIAPAPQAQAQPITEAEAIKLWHGDKEAHRRESAFEWYAAGLIAAQHHYGIATPASAAQKEPT